MFRDAADFAVVVLYDADNFYEHPRLKYLPDFDFSGVTLAFDALYDGLQQLDSAKYASIAWDVLSVIQADGTTRTLKLSDYAGGSPVSGTYDKASTTITVAADPGGAVIYDRVTIWYGNYAFDKIADGGESAVDVASALEAQINGVSWAIGEQAIECTRSGAVLTILAAKPGADGNMIRLYTQSKTSTLTLSPTTAQLTDGSSAATWHYSLDFSAIWTAKGWGSPQIRQMWLTLAPALADSAAYVDTEFVAEFSNWTVTGSNADLKVAGPGSVRIGSRDAWASYSGASWAEEASAQAGGTGWFHLGFARRASTVGDSVTIQYHCQSTHDLWLGTSLYSDRGKWGVVLDGDTETSLDCYIASAVPVVTRRQVRSGVAAGAHAVTLTLRTHASPSTGDYAYFDFLEAAVLADPPSAPAVTTTAAPACDYGTDHSYKLPPSRILWMLDELGLQGPMNVYVSVFWWNQRVRAGATFPTATIDFSQTTWASGNAAFVDIGGQLFGKSVFPADDAASIAQHFAFYINQTSVGVWASSSGAVLTLTLRAVGSAYSFSVSASKEEPGPVTTALTVGGALTGGTYGIWMVDPSQSPTINRGAREWLADLLAECATRSRAITLAYSMELLNPPADWAARYWNGNPVETATGFGSNVTTHCSFVSDVLDYQKRVFMDTADLMDAAGLPVELQCGEFVWWYFNNASPPTADPGGDMTKGMAFYDAETAAAAVTALGRPLVRFAYPDSDPSVNSYEDADFLRDRLDAHIRAIRTHVKATYPGAVIEVLLPLDVNYPSQYGRYDLGGALNHYIHTDPRLMDPSLAPVDRIKIEGLDFGAGSRDGDKARWAMRFPLDFGSWPRADVRYLVPWFNGGCPWPAEYLRAANEQTPVINFWAFDHICLMGWPVPLPANPSDARFL